MRTFPTTLARVPYIDPKLSLVFQKGRVTIKDDRPRIAVEFGAPCSMNNCVVIQPSAQERPLPRRIYLEAFQVVSAQPLVGRLGALAFRLASVPLGAALPVWPPHMIVRPRYHAHPRADFFGLRLVERRDPWTVETVEIEIETPAAAYCAFISTYSALPLPCGHDDDIEGCGGYIEIARRCAANQLPRVVYIAGGPDRTEGEGNQGLLE